VSSDFFSRPSSEALFWSLHTSGFARRDSTTLKRCFLPSKSKIPPQLGRPRIEIGEREGVLVELLCVHRAYFT
jgi:hypothetical protein